jgi:hypothetical protein
MSKEAARRAYEEAEVAPQDVQVVELHDCFSANELITYEALGFAAEGEGHMLVEKQATTYGGDGPVVNPSGGLISKGHRLAPPVSPSARSSRGSCAGRPTSARSTTSTSRSSTTLASAAPRW